MPCFFCSFALSKHGRTRILADFPLRATRVLLIQSTAISQTAITPSQQPVDLKFTNVSDGKPNPKNSEQYIYPAKFGWKDDSKTTVIYWPQSTCTQPQGSYKGNIQRQWTEKDLVANKKVIDGGGDSWVQSKR